MSGHIHGKRWIEEFRAEIAADHRALLEAKAQRQGWNFAVAVERTKAFYAQRIGGFHVCGSVTDTERDELLGLVDSLGAGDMMART